MDLIIQVIVPIALCVVVFVVSMFFFGFDG
jgi:hypothetical protein